MPIATGLIEGACRHLVEDRKNLNGACWSLSDAEAVFRLRALRSSHDFEAYWKLHKEPDCTRNHASHAIEHYVPMVALPVVSSSRPSPRSSLKIIR